METAAIRCFINFNTIAKLAESPLFELTEWNFVILY